MSLSAAAGSDVCSFYYVKHTLDAYNDKVNYYIPILAVLMVAQLIGMVIFGPVMRKTSKKMAIMIAAPVRLIGVLGLFAFSHPGVSLVPILALANAGLAQSAATQHGIGICFIMAPAILSALLLVVAILFPMTSEEFDTVQKEVARRKGEDTSKTTDEEKKMLESVTGFAYDKLWSKDNAGVKKGEPELL
ncbi:MAG: hypothetical protein MJ128_06110 [Mogibacterium sp.]|nr:hypothetical protein [Mogibacterium sp.]